MEQVTWVVANFASICATLLASLKTFKNRAFSKPHSSNCMPSINCSKLLKLGSCTSIVLIICMASPSKRILSKPISLLNSTVCRAVMDFVVVGSTIYSWVKLRAAKIFPLESSNNTQPNSLFIHIDRCIPIHLNHVCR